MNVNGTNAVVKTDKKEPGTLKGWLSERRNELLNAIPKGTVEIDRFMQSAFLAITNPKNPDLVKCDKGSIGRALREAASYGLELNGTLGQAYLIPYNESVKDANGNWNKIMTCHFQMGYKGLIALARRSNTIKTIAAECIYENDIFDCNLASGRSITHKMDIFKERGEVVGYYCLVELTNGGEQFAIMSKKDAEKFRDTYSKSYIMAKDKTTQNWGKNFDAMALKTCVIKALKLCPISIEALEAVSREEQADTIDDSFDVAYENQVEKNMPEKVIASEEVRKEAVTVETKHEIVPAENLANIAMSEDENAKLNAVFDSKPQQMFEEAIF